MCACLTAACLSRRRARLSFPVSFLFLSFPSLPFPSRRYETDAQRSSRCGEITTERLDQMRADGQTARALKEELLKTNVVIGSDEKFM